MVAFNEQDQGYWVFDINLEEEHADVQAEYDFLREKLNHFITDYVETAVIRRCNILLDVRSNLERMMGWL